MTPNPECLQADHTIDDALFKMQAGDFNHIPIVKYNQSDNSHEKPYLVGIVSNKDVFRHLSPDSRRTGIPLSRCMTRLEYNFTEETHRKTFHILIEEDDLSLAINYLATPFEEPGGFSKNYISALLIVNPTSHGNIVKGLISYKDVLRNIKIRDEFDEVLHNTSVKDWMYTVNQGLVSVDSDSSLTEVNTIFSTHTYRTIPVVEEDTSSCLKLIGIINQTSIFASRKWFPNVEEKKANDPNIMLDAAYAPLLLPDQSIFESMDYFAEYPYPGFMVVENKRSFCLLGILSYVDILKKLVGISLKISNPDLDKSQPEEIQP